MNPLPKNLLLVLFAFNLGGAGGCAQFSSTAKRAALTALGSATGAAAAYELAGRNPSKAIAGAIGGAAVTALAEGEDPNVRQAGFDEGYVRGQSDAIKRQYFLRRSLEDRPLNPASSEGETVYYLMPGPEVTVDGRKLEPHRVAVRVVE